MTPNQMMTALLGIDPTIHLEFSEHTERWFVKGNFGITDGCLWTGTVEHRTNPEEAVVAIFNRLTKLGPFESVVINAFGNGRKEYRWQGFMWKEYQR